MNTADKLTKEEKTTVAKNVFELMVLSFAFGFVCACIFIATVKP